MSTSKALVLGLAMLTVPLLGCIGTMEDPVEPAETQQVPPAPDLPETAAIVHQPGAENPVAPEAIDEALDRALGEDVPVPVGLERVGDFEAFEPTLGVTSTGTLFMSATEGSFGTDWTSIVRSTDGGQTWERANPSVGPVSSPPTTFDPYVHVDQDTDRVYNLDMEGLQCNYVQWSDDEGETWTSTPLGCGQPPVMDHPTLFTGPPREATTYGYENVVYICVNRVADAACAMSFDGGYTYTPWRTIFPETSPEGEAGCGGLHGHGVTGPEGRAYVGKVHCDTPMLAVTEDDGLTWEVHTISEDVTSPKHDVELATDDAGNVYALWIDDDLDPYLSVSTDHGSSWSKPTVIAAPGVETAQFPAIAAGEEGKIALVYIGTPSDTEVSEMEDDVAWTGYLATIPDATTANLTIATSPLNTPEHPIARGPCDDDNRCDGIGDFVDIVIDEDGRPWAALVDVCHDECSAEDGNDQALGAIGTLETGFALRGEASSLQPLEATSGPADNATANDSSGSGSLLDRLG